MAATVHHGMSLLFGSTRGRVILFWLLYENINLNEFVRELTYTRLLADCFKEMFYLFSGCNGDQPIIN